MNCEVTGEQIQRTILCTIGAHPVSTQPSHLDLARGDVLGYERAPTRRVRHAQGHRGPHRN